MRRLEKLLTAAVVVAFLVAACGSEKQVDGPARADVAPGEANPPKAADKPSKPATAPIYAPMIFHAEAGPLVTSACLSFEEISPEAGFGGVQSVFDAQMQAFKAQYADAQAITSSKIGHAYAFDDFVVVNAVIHRGDKQRTWPFSFSRSPDGQLAPWSELKQSPDGTLTASSDSKDKPSKALVRDWLEYASPGKIDPPHCAPDVVEHATHRVPIGPESSQGARLHLLLRGAAFDSPGDLRVVAQRVTATLKAIEQAVTAKDIHALMKHLSDGCAKQLDKWWASASAQERDGYFQSFAPAAPFFVFDASPLVIAYARQRSSIRVGVP